MILILRTMAISSIVMNTYYQMCIETILPPTQRPDSAGVERIIDTQYPVGPWMEVPDWFKMVEALPRLKPIMQYGLLYGQRKKEVDEPDPMPARIAEAWALKDKTKDEVMAYFDRIVQARQERLAKTCRDVDAFLATFPVTAYSLAHFLDGSK